ncbi:MAG: STAS domain-containing protein [Firmicutes bacterium]|nr:STAS domain-containing protein [Alicyclobacillaceae bacterium]MCL6496701.1 STAS domain-containing protein [Bacillota bacterium]
MTIVHLLHGPRLVVALKGDLDLKSAGELRQALDQLIDRFPDRDLIIDLTEVEFVDSSGLGVILGRYKRLSARGRSLQLTGVRPPVRTVLDLAGIAKLVTISDHLPKSPVR